MHKHQVWHLKERVGGGVGQAHETKIVLKQNDLPHLLAFRSDDQWRLVSQKYDYTAHNLIDTKLSVSILKLW